MADRLGPYLVLAWAALVIAGSVWWWGAEPAAVGLSVAFILCLAGFFVTPFVWMMAQGLREAANALAAWRSRV